MQKKIILRYIFWFLTFLVMAMIFYLSSQNGTQSTVSSTNVTEIIAEIFNPEYDNLSETDKIQILNNAAGLVRTTGHFFEYFMLSSLVICALMTYNIKAFKIIIIGALICVIYAVSDEVHQLFVSGRACEFFDIMIDSAGIFAGAGFVFLIIKIFKIKRIMGVSL